MQSYKVSPLRRPAYVVTVICFLCGCLLLLSPLFGVQRYLSIIQCVAVGFWVAAVLVTNRYLLTNYLYEIETEPNPLSELPKLNIYASRGHNFGHQFYCIPLEKAYSIEKMQKKEKQPFRTVNSCGSMYPPTLYLVKYDCDGSVNGAWIECGDAFAAEVAALIKRYGIDGEK